MKITIDTSQDSHSEIKKAIRMLQSIVGNHDEVYTNSPSRNIFDDPSPSMGASSPAPVAEDSSNNAFASIFDEPASSSTTEEAKEEDQDEEIPQIEFF